MHAVVLRLSGAGMRVHKLKPAPAANSTIKQRKQETSASDCMSERNAQA
eukprot:SAG11_NODE_61_length_19011_cov_49.624048_6_plen_49_part_00